MTHSDVPGYFYWVYWPLPWTGLETNVYKYEKIGINHQINDTHTYPKAINVGGTGGEETGSGMD